MLSIDQKSNIDLPISLLAGKRWEAQVAEWIDEARQESVASRQRMKLIHLRSAIEEFPDETARILAEVQKRKT